jgi:hypothetical protein
MKDTTEWESPFSDEIKPPILNLQRRLFNYLFEGLVCDNQAHKDFSNVIIATLTEQPSFKVEKICCRDFELKIRNSIM